MQLTMTGRKMEITDSLRSFTEKKIKKVEKFFHRDLDVRVVLSVEKLRHSAEVTIASDGLILHTKEITDDMYTSIDKLMDKIEKLVKKHKKRVVDKHSRKESKLASLGAVAGLEEDEALPVEGKNVPRIVRGPDLDKASLTEEEAAERLQDSGDAFLMFRNSGTREINVIYKKFDGDFGLIEP